MIVTDGNRLNFNNGGISGVGGNPLPYVLSFNSRQGAVSLTSEDVTNALGFIPQEAGEDGGEEDVTVDISDVTGLQAELDSKQDAGSYSLVGHTHVISDVTGLQTALDGKQATGSYADAVHTHVIADVTGLQGALDAKAAVSHTHVIGDVTGLQASLDSKQPTGSYATGGGTATGTNTGDQTSIVGITGTLAQFNTALTGADFATGGGTATGTNTGDQTSITGNAGTATTLQTPRTINGVSFNGSANITINAVDSTARVPETRTISTTAPLAGGGDLSANRTLSIVAATTSVAGSMSAADKTKLDAITGTNTGNQTTIVGITGTLAEFNAALTGADFTTGGGTATGTNTGDETKATIDTKIGATGGTDFYRKDGTWAAAGGGGGVTSVGGTAPIVSSGGTTPDISITAATTGAAGSMSAQDKARLDAVFPRYHSLLDSSASHSAGKGATTYGFGQGDPTLQTGGGALYPINIIYLDPADYPAAGTLTAKLRVRVGVYCNDVAPTGNYTFGLHPVTRPATSGGAGLASYTIGAAVAGSTVLLSAPAADSANTIVSADFAVPAAGHYVLGMVTNTPPVTSAHMHISALLQMRYT